jgi:16S rRNA (cytidine1402-2'-O)-methyltransferase
VATHENRPGTLWIVATPIGSLGDLAPRAVEVLDQVSLILAEDTRRAKALLAHFHVAAAGRLRSLHEHNESRQVPGLVERLQGGCSIALMSDAGTPVLSDPGYRLVRAAREAELPVASVPGASSFTAALAASGQPPLPALLCGFLPPRRGPRRRRIGELADHPWTMVVLLSPHRLQAELGDLAEGLGVDRPATLLAELSKRFERARTGTLGDLVVSSEPARPRGEYVIVIGPATVRENQQTSVTADAVRAAYEEALDRGLDRKQALRSAATQHGISRREVYALIMVDDDS